MRVAVSVITSLCLAACTDDSSPFEPDAGVVALDDTSDDTSIDTQLALPDITSGNGITVTSVTAVSARTFDIRLSTPNVSETATTRGNGARVTLPPDYATSGKRYPVIYLLHGAGGGSFQDMWAGGVLETIASGSNAEVIVVMPDGGKGGWYTDWLDQSIAQRWETYHLTQLVPFIDRNLRTLGTREGRGIMGLSMGGFGAIHYAGDRPDLFAAATSLSGAVDLEHAGIQSAVIAPSILFGLPPFGAFGGPGILSPVWRSVNPVRHPDRLSTVATILEIGAGTDIGELAVRQSTMGLRGALVRAGVSHVFVDYGVPGQTPLGECNGGHTVVCGRYALADALPRMLAVLADPQ